MPQWHFPDRSTPSVGGLLGCRQAEGTLRVGPGRFPEQRERNGELSVGTGPGCVRGAVSEAPREPAAGASRNLRIRARHEPLNAPCLCCVSGGHTKPCEHHMGQEIREAGGAYSDSKLEKLGIACGACIPLGANWLLKKEMQTFFFQ